MCQDSAVEINPHLCGCQLLIPFFIDSPLFAVIEFLYLPCSSVHKCLSRDSQRYRRGISTSHHLSAEEGAVQHWLKEILQKLRQLSWGLPIQVSNHVLLMSAGDCRKKLFHWMGKVKGIICNFPALTYLFWVAHVKASLKGNFILLYRTVERLQYMSLFWNVCMFKVQIHL